MKNFEAQRVPTQELRGWQKEAAKQGTVFYGTTRLESEQKSREFQAKVEQSEQQKREAREQTAASIGPIASVNAAEEPAIPSGVMPGSEFADESQAA